MTTFFWSRSLTVTTDSVTVTVTVTILTVIIVTVSHGNFIKSLSSNTKLEKMRFTTTAIREEPKQIHMWIFLVFFWAKSKRKLRVFVYITFQRNFHKNSGFVEFSSRTWCFKTFFLFFLFCSYSSRQIHRFFSFLQIKKE